MKHLDELVDFLQSPRFNRMKALDMAQSLQKRVCENCHQCIVTPVFSGVSIPKGTSFQEYAQKTEQKKDYFCSWHEIDVRRGFYCDEYLSKQ